MPKKRETRPTNHPVAVRFTDEMLSMIDEVSESMQLSKQDVIRLSVTAGLTAMKKMGYKGITEAIAKEIEKSRPSSK